MRTLTLKISKIKNDQRGFSLIEILVALLLVSLVVISFPSSDTTEKHRNLKSAVADIERSIGFASNESILRNTVVRLRISFDKDPIEYNVEYGPPGNMPLPDMPEKAQKSLEQEKADAEKISNLDKSFTKVTEFEEIRHELSENVQILGIATSFQKKIITDKEASIYFYSTGEKDAALIFFATDDEIAYIEVQPFLSETRTVFEALKTESVAKKEDILQTKMDEVYREWIKH
ncbi:MAG: prepilin-type N-terminal cleavage/methylation domain-containing protein [Bdellovibrionales bacterium]|nr:prepilin-type N-terminal cleavage/methylation domain-containing protein [Bdellovibrionales bacterium]